MIELFKHMAIGAACVAVTVALGIFAAEFTWYLKREWRRRRL